MAVSLRLPDDVKSRVEKQASAQETTPHAFMLEAIREKLEAEELRAQFYEEAKRRLERMKKTGKGIPAGEVFDYLIARVEGRNVARPKARKLL